MSKASGVVDKIYSKKGKSGGRSYTRYSINMDGDWYNCGFEPPDCAEGDEVEITYVEGDYGKEVKKITGGEASGGKSDSKSKKSSHGKDEENTSNSYQSKNTTQIHRQSCLRHATALAIAQNTLNLETIVEIANKLVYYVEHGSLEAVEIKAPKKAAKRIEDMEDDIEDIK